MEREQIRAFLNRVATEPAYRELLETDPVGTLAEIGVTISESDVPPEGVRLPTNAEILANLDTFTDELSPNLCLRVLSPFIP